MPGSIDILYSKSNAVKNTDHDDWFVQTKHYLNSGTIIKSLRFFVAWHRLPVAAVLRLILGFRLRRLYR